MLGLKIHDNADFGAEIIRAVREGDGLSRVELARVLGVAASTIGRHVDSLVDAGYFTETLETSQSAGRPPTRLRPNPARGCFLGVDFNATDLFATVVDFAQNTIKQIRRPLDEARSVPLIVEHLSKAIKDLAAEAGLPVLSVGIAAPGRVDNRKGIALHYAHVPGFENVPLASLLKPVVPGASVFIENNIRAMALAERWFGEGRGCLDLICLGVRIGVSAGVIRNGGLATGHRGLGGEIRGWNCPVYNGEKEKWEWKPGATIEKHASVPAAAARFASLRGKKAGHEDFLKAAREGDKHALMAVKEVAAIHGWAISQMAQIVDPEVVVLAGPLTTVGNVYLDTVRNIALQFESDYHPSIPILVSELGEHAGSVGAAALALERWRPADMG